MNSTINHERLLERFLRYVRIDTTAREGQTVYPSSPGQLELGADAAKTSCRRWAWPTRVQTRDGDRAGHAAGERRLTRCRWWRSTRMSTPRPRPPAPACGRRSSATTAAATFALPASPHAVIRVADNPELASARRAHAHHDRRHDAAGRRRQGGRGRDHGDRGASGRASARSSTARCGSASPATKRSATASITSTWRSWAPTVCYTLDGQGSRRDRRRNVFGRPGDRHGPRRQHSSVDRQGADGQRGARGGRLRRQPAARDAGAGDDRGIARAFCIPITSKGAWPKCSCGFCCAISRRRELARAGRAAATDGRSDCQARLSRRGDRRADHAAVSQHGRGAGPRAAGRGVRRCARSSGLGARRGGRSSAAAPTARGSPSWACRRPTSRPASTIRTRRWNGPAWRKWARRSKCSSSWCRSGPTER